MRASISIAIAGLLCSGTYASAQPNKELYELQERCGKRAEELFRREYGPGDSKYGMLFNYESHYSACEEAERIDRGKTISHRKTSNQFVMINGHTARQQEQAAIRDAGK